MRITLFTLLISCLSLNATAQLVTIYAEDFNSYPDGTTGGNGWSGSGNDCDGHPNSRYGVYNGRFEWRDMEGTCGCGVGPGSGGQTDNVFEVGPIDIFGCNVTASINIAGSGGSNGFECDSPGAPSYNCDNSHDQMVVEYSVNGGPYQLFPGGYVCGANGLGTKTIAGLSGSTLSIRVTGGNKANDEVYYIDNIVVRGSSNATVAIAGPASVCAGGSITLNASAGFASYIWNPNGEDTQSIDVTAPGTYRVTATTSAGCTATAMKNITLAPAPNFTITGTNQLCDGGNGTLTINPAFSSYEWSSGQNTKSISINAPGAYDATVTDASGCTAMRTFNVNGGAPPNVTISTTGGQRSICSGSSLTLTASGAGITSYRWSNGATTNSTTINRGDTYTVTVTNAQGCENEASIDIEENIRPTITNPGVQTGCGMVILPVINGTNLTGNEAYFSGPNGTGASFLEGEEIPSSRVLYIFDGFTGCTSQLQVNIVVTPKPDVNDLPDQPACNAYVLPAITGTNLTNGRAYYTAPNGTGTKFNPGDSIKTNRTLYIFDGTATCNDQESFAITVTPGPTVNDLRDTSLCGTYVLPMITGMNLSAGNSAYYTGTGATGTRFNPGQTLSTTQTLFIYNGIAGCFNEQNVTITLTAGPQINNLNDTTICTSFLLPAIAGTNLTGNQAYFTAPGGTGTRLNAGANITTTQTLYLFDTDGTCTDEDTFNITIATTPTINDLADVSECGFYVLPAITGTNLSNSQAYYTQPGGTGTRLSEGDTIRSNSNLFLYDGAPGCNDEESVAITILQPPVLNPLADQSPCTSYVLPAITGMALSGNEAYFSQPNGAGTRFAPGDTLLTSGTFYTFDDNGSCTNQDTFNITILQAPVLNPIADRTACVQYLLPVIQGSNLSANVAYFTQPNGAGTRFAPRDTIKTTTLLYAFDTNGACTAQDTFTISITPNPSANIRATNVTCNGGTNGTLEAVVLGNAPFRFDWNVNELDGQQNATAVAAGNYNVTITDVNNCIATANATITQPAALLLECSAQKPVSVMGTSDGEAQVIVGSGVAPYTLSWSGPTTGSLNIANPDTITISNLAGGRYDLTLTDASGCPVTCDFTIGMLGCDIVLSALITNASCPSDNDGRIDVSLTRATLPIRYDWNVDSLDGIEDPTGLSLGTYTLNAIDSNNCVVQGTYLIGTRFPQPDATISYSTVICENGCFEFDMELVGTPPFFLNYQLTTNIGDIFRTVQINSNRDTLEICPAALRTDTGYIVIQFLGLRDANCQNQLDRRDTLLVRPVSRDTIAPTLCSTDSMVVNNRVYNQASPNGTTTIFGGASNGCDSVITIALNFYPPAILDINQTLCETDSVVVNGVVYNQQNPNGTEILSGASINGCDSTVNINLQFYAPAVFTINPTICETDSVVVNGTVYNSNNPNGTEILRGAAEHGCDSLIQIDLQFFPLATFDLNQTICETDSIVVNGTVYNSNNPNGTETIRGAAVNGCDSIININLQFFPRAIFDLTQTLCETDSIVVNGTVYNQNNPRGTETIRGAATNACDSIVNINLQFISSVSFDLNQTICATDSVVVNGTVYNQSNPSGTETLIGASSTGCDSIVNINISIFPAAILNLDSTLCEGDSVVVNGKVYNQANPNGTELIPGGSINGCDSTINIQLTYRTIARTTIDTTLCTGGMLIVNGTTYDVNNLSGTETIPGGAANGCDSVIQVQVRFFTPVVFDLNQTICESDSIIVNGRVYNQNNPNGTETLIGASTNGCDSTVNINLQFFPPVIVNLDTTLCEGETLTVNGTIYNENNSTGTEIFSNATTNGCDSTVNVKVTFVPPATFDLNQTICENDSLVVNGTVYNQNNPTGTETFAHASANGCDSIVNINLSFFPTAVFDLNQTLCEGDSLVVNGTVYNQNNPSGTETLIDASVNGCDSTVHINLTFLQAVRINLDTLLCPGESLLVNGKTFDVNNPGGTEILRGASANGCDSIIQVNLRFRPAVSGSIEGNTSICAGDSATLTFRLSGAPIFDIRYTDGTNTVTLNGISDGHTIRVAPSQTTTYTITFIAINGATCPAQLGGSATIQVSNLTANATVTSNFAGFGVSCFGADDGSVRAEGMGGVSPIAYRWNTGATTQIVQNLAPGNYTVTLTDAAGCTAFDSVTINAPQQIVINNSVRSPVCASDKNGVILIDSISGGAAPFEVSLNGTSYRAVSSFPYQITNLSAGNYTVFVRDANDCETSFSTAILAPSIPEVNLGPDITIRLGDSVELVGLANFDPTNIQWRPDTFLTAPNALRTFVSVTETTTYTLSISDTSGCKASDQITVFLDRQRAVFIPTAFTPDGDGINDFFFINGGKDVAQIKELRIFDRWGNLMFQRGEMQPNDPQLGWDGTFNGKKVGLGVYVYYAAIEFIDGAIETFEGGITVVR